ncbi:MAG: hypothetical protein AB8B91_05115 [Rubripirellula sp.]
MPSPATPNLPDDVWREQCLLYLFGELDAEKSAKFAERLESSPPHADELLRQAEMITALPACDPAPVSAFASESGTLPAGSKRWGLVLVATAASLLLAFVAWQAPVHHVAQVDSQDGLTNAAVSEELLIARTWAKSRHLDAFEVGLNEFNDFDDVGDAPVELNEGNNADLETDSTLSWMFAAVSTNLEIDHTNTEKRATNDG